MLCVPNPTPSFERYNWRPATAGNSPFPPPIFVSPVIAGVRLPKRPSSQSN